jgi:DNA-binding CsgD family transcriptional regulator
MRRQHSDDLTTDSYSHITLPENLRRLLREADSMLVSMVGESHYLLYRLIYRTACQIAQTDAFYIGFFGEGDMIVYPFNMDGEVSDDPNTNQLIKGGLGEWIRENKQPYWSKQDNGYLLNRGRVYGNPAKLSADAIAVPILEVPLRGEPRVLGLLSMQSYRANSYDEIAVVALQWLANSLGIVMAREREDQARRSRLGHAPEQNSSTLRLDAVVNEMLEKMASIRRRAESLIRPDIPLPEEIRTSLEEIRQECIRRQTETIELFMRSAMTEDSPVARLSEQERRIVSLLVEGYALQKNGYTNREIAERLFVVEDTVKTHLKAVYRKFGVSGRTGVAEIARAYMVKTIF